MRRMIPPSLIVVVVGMAATTAGVDLSVSFAAGSVAGFAAASPA